MYLKLSAVFAYLKCTPNSRCFLEGEGILNSEHLVQCGVKDKNSEKWTIKAYCVQTSSIKANPHEVSGVFNVSNEVEIVEFQCTCKAGASGSCKHVTATLLFCTREPMEKLKLLSCTDTECIWKEKRPEIEKKYESHALHESKCFNSVMVRETSIQISKDEIKKIFEQAALIAPQSEFSLHLKGRRQNINFKNSQPLNIPAFIEQIYDKSVQSSFLTTLDIKTDQLPSCCQQVILSMKNDNIKEAMCYDQGSVEWKAKRRNRITGTTCYPLYTFKKNDWTTMIKNFLNPKIASTKPMAHGLEMEAEAFNMFQKNNPTYDIKKIGIAISSLYPWFGYSPDGVTFENGTPQRLLEIKCPYLGKIKSPEEVLPTLPYLKENFTLKENHTYYGQIQMGMALLNLEYCDFIVYFSKNQTYLQITVPFNSSFAKNLLETITKKYLNNIIHYICQYKNN